MSHVTRDHQERDNAYEVAHRTQSNTCTNAGVAVVCVLEFCGRKCEDLKDLLTHIKEHISAGLEICCPFHGCDKHFSKKSSFTSHLSRCHRNYSVQDVAKKFLVDHDLGRQSGSHDCEDNLFEPNVPISESDIEENEDHELANADFGPDTWVTDYTKCIALFLLKLQTKNLIPVKTIQGIVDELHFMQQSAIDLSVSYIKGKVATIGLSEEAHKEVDDIINSMENLSCSLMSKSESEFRSKTNPDLQKPECGILRSDYLRKKYFQREFKYVAPNEIVLEEKESTHSTHKKKKECFHYVPIQETLKVMCEDKSMKNHMLRLPMEKERGVFEDVHDGRVFKRNAFFTENPNSLQIILFQDACEISNPLGAAKKKHKILAVYFTLGNLDPRCRSIIDPMQLVLLCKESYLKKYGHDQIFGPLIKDIQALEQSGITLESGEILKGSVLVICGDNLGSHCIGGYCESFQSHYYCRYCTLTKTQIAEMHASTEKLRTPETYNRIIQQLQDSDEEKFEGIKFDSVFNSLDHFHVAMPGLPPCLGHDLFEGVVDFDLTLCIAYFIDKKWFTLDLFNEKLAQFPFCGNDVPNRPFAISKTKLGGHAVQNWWTLRFFTLVVFELVQDIGDEVWKFVLCLKEIVELVVSPVIDESQLAYLNVLIQEYLYNRRELFALESLKPKHHFLSHYPWLILNFGPLIRLWTLRFESKHSYFKRAVRQAQNSINITSMLAERHQLLQAYSFHGQVFPDDVIVKKGALFHQTLYATNIQTAVHHLNVGTKQYVVTDEVSVFGTRYKKGMYLMARTGETDWTFGKMLFSLVFEEEVNFVVRLCESCYLADYGIYEVRNVDIASSVVCVTYSNLVDYYPLSSYRKGRSHFITLKNKPKNLH